MEAHDGGAERVDRVGGLDAECRAARARRNRRRVDAELVVVRSELPALAAALVTIVAIPVYVASRKSQYAGLVLLGLLTVIAGGAFRLKNVS